MFFKPKQAREDFEESMLPQNRKEVFKDVVKLHFLKLLFCGLILLGFAIPLIVVSLLKDTYQLSVLSALADSSLSSEEAVAGLQTSATISSVANIICYVIFSIGLSGVARILKRLAWEENVGMGSDFLKGIKQNAVHYIILALALGILSLACTYISDMSFTGVGTAYYLGIAVTALCALILGPVGAFMTVTISVYGISFFKNVRYAIILFKKNFFKTLGVCALFFLPFLVQMVLQVLIPQYFSVTIILKAITCLAIPFIMLGWFLYAYNCLDKSINKDYFPELVNKGLYIPAEPEIKSATEGGIN